MNKDDINKFTSANFETMMNKVKIDRNGDNLVRLLVVTKGLEVLVPMNQSDYSERNIKHTPVEETNEKGERYLVCYSSKEYVRSEHLQQGYKLVVKNFIDFVNEYYDNSIHEGICINPNNEYNLHVVKVLLDAMKTNVLELLLYGD